MPLSATPAVWADTLPGGENESALVMVEKNGDVAITQDNFPDDTFRQMVKDEFDTNGDNVLSQGERDAVTALDVQEGPVASLKGVEVFPHLQVLNAQLCRLTELDLSQNTELEAAFVSNNRLVSLTLPKDNHTLKVLDVMGNRLTTLDVSGLKALTFLHVNDNFLTELDLSGCALTDGQGFIATYNVLNKITLPDNGTEYPLSGYLWEQNAPKGYTVQWYEDAGHSRPLAKNDTVLCQGQTLYVAYEPISYKVAFSSGSQKVTGTAGSLTLSYDQAGHLPGALTPVDSDWQFVGWQIGSTVYAAGSTAKNLTDVDGKTVTATAVWQVKGFSGQSYQVVLHNGTESQVLTAYFGKAFTPNGSAFTKDHATLSGWSLTENGAVVGSDTVQGAGLQAQEGKTVTLYAVWEDAGFGSEKPQVQATASTGGVKVQWTALPGAEGYRVYRDSGKGFVLLTTVKTLSYTDTGAGNGQAVRYAIEAVRGTAVSQKGVSGTVTRLSTPSVSVKAGTGSVTVSWGSVKGAKSYVVYRKVAGGSWQRIATTTSIKYTDKKAKKGVSYSYTVRAVAGSSQSAYKASGSVKAR